MRRRQPSYVVKPQAERICLAGLNNMIPPRELLTILLPLVLAWVCSAANAQPSTQDKVEELRKQGYSVQAISPVFSQLVLLSLPAGFKAASENTKGDFYIRESVPAGETVDRWTQMITVTGAKGLAANPNVTPQSVAGGIATGFQRACPSTFFAKGLGALKISGQDAFVALASCGTAPSGPDKHSETAMVIAIKGAADYYTIQWAQRGAASDRALAPDEALWADRFKQLNPIKVCTPVPGEAAPYPSCINQK
jgi:hypothetical protein